MNPLKCPEGRNDHYRRWVSGLVSRALVAEDASNVHSVLSWAIEAAELLWLNGWFTHNRKEVDQ